MSSPLSPRPVLCVSHGFQTNYERGFCNGLAAQGVALTLVSSDRSDRAGLLPAVHTVNLRGSQEENRPRWRKALNLVRYHISLMGYALWRRDATLHVMGLLAPLVWCALVQGLWFRLVCARYVLTVHDLLPHDAHTAWNRRICRWAYRLPHCVVVHTQRMKQALVSDFGLRPGDVLVMEHGIEPQGEAGVPGEDAPREPVPLLLAFGAVLPRKGTDLLLEAVASLPFEFRLVVAGPCPDEAFRQHLRARIEVHPQRERIDWRDAFVPEREMDQLFQRADVLVLPYRYIDQSGVLFQALRFGTPVVATRVGQFEHYVSSEVGELAAPDDIASLRAALERWCARRTSFSRARIQAIGGQYAWPTTVLALRAAYV